MFEKTSKFNNVRESQSNFPTLKCLRFAGGMVGLVDKLVYQQIPQKLNKKSQYLNYRIKNKQK
jgi:hypothetical protein